MKRELRRPGLAVSVDFVNSRGFHLYNAPDINSPDPITRIRPNLNLLRITQHETTGNSWYNGLLVALEKRSGSGPAFGVSYTLARQIRDVEDFLFSGQDQLNRTAEKALADNHRTHQLVAATTWSLPAGFQIGAILQARSGLPWTVTTGTDNNGDNLFTNDRPDLVVSGGDPRNRATYSAGFTGRVGNLGRNTAIGPSFVELAARVSKVVKLPRGKVEAFVEAFNVTNRPNFGKPVGNLRSALFGTSTGLAGSPRQVEIGLRMDL